MSAVVVTYLPFLLSAITCYTMLLAGNKKPGAWAVGLVNQLLWLIWIVLAGAWGLIPMNLVLWVVYARNFVKWRAEP